MPRVSKDTPSRSLGFKGDFFSEVLHALRSDVRFSGFVSSNMHIKGCDDMRDSKSIARVATGILKLLFPDRSPSEPEFVDYCVRPAMEMRQRIRDELHKMDADYSQVTFAVG
jgi:ATP-dependent Lon protease